MVRELEESYFRSLGVELIMFCILGGLRRMRIEKFILGLMKVSLLICVGRYVVIIYWE